MIKKKKDLIGKLKDDLDNITNEIKNDVTGPVVASFGFIIALIWRDAIRSTLDEILLRLGLLENIYIYEIISAIIITICVIIIMISVKKFGDSKKIKNIKKIKRKMKELED